MWPDRLSNPGPLTYESGALPTALRGPASALVGHDIIITGFKERRDNSVNLGILSIILHKTYIVTRVRTVSMVRNKTNYLKIIPQNPILFGAQ